MKTLKDNQSIQGVFDPEEGRGRETSQQLE